MFRIVIVGGPAEGYIKECLQSLQAQTVTDWTACVVLDPVGDKTIEQAESFCGADPRIKVISNAERKFALWNTCVSIESMPCEPEDILVSIDADDWLAGSNSLEVVKAAYDSDPKLLLTYGSWLPFPNPKANTNTKAPYTEADFKVNIRKMSWRASHLKTFKHKLWAKVNH